MPVPPFEAETLDQCQGRLYALSEDAKRIYRQITGTGGLVGIANTLSGEAKRLHTEFCEVLDSSARILEGAERIASGLEMSGAVADEEAEAEFVDAAREETEALLIRIDEREQEDILRVAADFAEKVAARISPRMVSDISDLERLVLPDPEACPETMCEYVSLGSYECEIKSWPFVGKVAPVDTALRDVFGVWYSNGFVIAPALLDRAERSSVFFCGDASETKAAMASIAVAELEISTAPMQTFVLMNPTGERDAFEPFLAAAKSLPEVFGEGVLTERRAIADAFGNAVSVINDRSQRLLIGYKDIFEFNADVETASLPLMTICAVMPVRFITDQMREDIESIVRNGSACGVNILLALDIDDGAIDEAASLLGSCSKAIVEWSEDGVGMVLDGGIKMVRNPVDARYVATLIPRLEEQVRRQRIQSVGLESVLPRASWFEGDSANGLSIPMGKSPEGRRVALEFGPEIGIGISHFGLLIGSTGSGKSSLLHSIIISALLKYGPDELQLYLLDFKSGIEFDVYSSFRIPHLRLLALDALQAFGHSILLELRDRMEERSGLFNDAGVQNLEDYRAATGKAMPRILVIMDEFQTLFNEDHDRVTARECAVLLSDFVSLARAYGIHFLLSTQTLSRLRSGSFSVSQSTLDEIHVRIGLQCSQSESERLFGSIFGREAYEKMGNQKGSGVFTENDLKNAPESFRAVFCAQEERIALLSEIESRYSAIEPSSTTHVFRSDTVPDILSCPGFDAPDSNEPFTSVPVFLGEAVKIGPPITLQVNRLRRSTLLVAGSDRRMLDRIVASYILSALRAVPMVSDPDELAAMAANPSVYVCDGLSLVGESGDDAVTRVGAKWNGSIKQARSNAEVLKLLDELYGLLIRRRDDANRGIARRCHTVHLVINEFQWIDAFKAVFERRDESYLDKTLDGQKSACSSILDDIIASVEPVDGTSSSRLKKLEELLMSGYSYGINVVVSSSDFAATKERIYDLVPKLQDKVVFALSGEDADRIVHGTFSQIEAIRSNMALFSDGVNPPSVFKPYRISLA